MVWFKYKENKEHIQWLMIYIFLKTSRPRCVIDLSIWTSIPSHSTPLHPTPPDCLANWKHWLTVTAQHHERLLYYLPFITSLRGNRFHWLHIGFSPIVESKNLYEIIVSKRLEKADGCCPQGVFNSFFVGITA